jgi:hypothetical protein
MRFASSAVVSWTITPSATRGGSIANAETPMIDAPDLFATSRATRTCSSACCAESTKTVTVAIAICTPPTDHFASASQDYLIQIKRPADRSEIASQARSSRIHGVRWIDAHQGASAHSHLVFINFRGRQE